MRLEKTTALVTGASSGIGEAVGARFRREGARLLLTGRRERLDSAHPEDKLRENVRLAVRRCATAWTGKKPLVEVMLVRTN